MWSLYELACLCCGSLDHYGANPYSCIYWQKAAGILRKRVSDTMDHIDDIVAGIQDFNFARQEIDRGMRTGKLLPIYPPKNLQDEEYFSAHYHYDPYFRPENAIQWANAKPSIFPEFPFTLTAIQELPDIFSLNRDNSLWFRECLEQDLWSWSELRNLCCGVGARYELGTVDSLHSYNEFLFYADEAIRRAVFIGELKLFGEQRNFYQDESDDACDHGCLDSLLHRTDPSWLWSRSFEPSVAITWASARFRDFPFTQIDCLNLTRASYQENEPISSFSNEPAKKLISREDLTPSHDCWHRYGKLIHLPLKEVIWLSLGIRPDWESLLVNTQDVIQQFSEENPNAVILTEEIPEIDLEINQKNMLSMRLDYRERLNVALNHADESNWKYDDMPRGQFTESNRVRLHEFCAWLIQHDFEVHERFRAIWGTKEVLVKGPIDEISEPLTSASRWKKRAKEIGEQYLQDYGIQGNTSDNSRDPTLEEISKQIAKQLKQEGFLSNRKKPISSDTVLRDALSGTWYQEMVDKGLTRQR